MPNHDSLVPYLFTRNIALRRVIESILNNCANTQASPLQMHLYPPFIQVLIRKNTRCQRLDRYFCTQATCSQIVQTLRIVVGNLHLPFFVSVPSLNFLWYIYIQFYIQNIYNAIAIQIVR